MVCILLFTIDTYEDTISVNPDTSYLEWNSTFPAISLCYAKGRTNQISNFLKEYWQATNFTPTKRWATMNAFAMAQTYLFVSPNSNLDEDITGICEGLNSTCNLNLQVMKTKFLPSDCKEVLFDVKFIGEPYDCDRLFEFTLTEMGSCFTTNSIYNHGLQFEQLPLQFNFWTRKRRLEFRYRNHDTINYMMYIHSPEDYPNFVEPFYALRKSGFVSHFMLQITETVNKQEVKDEPIDKRNCKFPSERLSPTLAYSFSQCFLYNRIQLELQFCNCTIPTSPKEFEEFYCDFKGLLCINKANVKYYTKHVHAVHKESSCMQSCESLETHVIGETYQSTETASEPGKVILEVLNVPIFRYQRRVIRNKLDFVVSLGGIGGLFFGVSLISIIELIYSMFFKPYNLKVKFSNNKWIVIDKK
ncbi:sodium channel protein Nach [Anopheles nili]|uniref:sodium channel protein Nach n=1 Tax=Anopheles nili TaxID=185578 RepID=UPI00237AC39A|nr:sodium channel protein Nach [Anopheles nili]